MRVEIRGNGLVVTDAIAGWMRDRLLAALDRHEPQVHRVQVWLRDINGSRHGGEDMECDLIARMRGRHVVIVKEHQADLYSAMSAAAGRLKNAVTRRVARIRRGRTHH